MTLGTNPAANGTNPPVISPEDARRLARHTMAFRDADTAKALGQLVPTLALYVGLCAALLWAVAAEQYWALAVAIPAGLLLVRLFTMQHDCGHGSFFASKMLNTWTGRALSVLTFTPYGYWRRAHALHHASAGDLGRRGIGDVDTYTLAEYRALSRRDQIAYRIYRHPLVLHVVGPPLYFVLWQRSPFGQALSFKEAWRSILALDAALVAAYGALAFALGWWPVLIVFLAVASVASWVGAWLFFVQHQFEDTHWAGSDEWDLQAAALNGSSHYVMPAWLNWVTGDIGLHHVHHLNARVPNYRLRECLEADETLPQVSRLTMAESLRCLGLALWDEESGRLVPFRAAHA